MKDLMKAQQENFNSTMVRLKDTRKSQVLFDAAFQFHYGTIKSLLHLRTVGKERISIPLWYD